MIVYLGSNELKKVYLGNTEIKKIYVGDKLVYPKREPDSNIMLYLPLEDDIAEKTGRSSITNYGVTLTTLNGIKCGYFNGSSRIESNLRQYNNTNHTLGVRAYYIYGGAGSAISANPCGVYNGDTIGLYDNGKEASYISRYNNTNWHITKTGLNCNDSRHHIMFSGGVLYVDGQSVGSGSGSYVGNQVYTIGGHTTNSTCTRGYMKGYLREVLIGKAYRTAQEVLNYYNYSKAKFGL